MEQDELNKFYHQATASICSSLDIVSSIQALFSYLAEVMPMSGILLALRCPNEHQFAWVAVGAHGASLPDKLQFNDIQHKDKVRMDYLHEYLGQFPRFALCNEKRDFPPWLDKALDGTDIPPELNGSLPLIISRISLSGKSLGILWFIGKKGQDFVDKDLECIQVLHDPIAIVLSARIQVLEAENLRHTLKDERRLFAQNQHSPLIGQSVGLQSVLEKVHQVAPTTANVLIFGETGTGKEIIAKLVHQLSLLRDKPLVTINCASLPDQLLESELFGHVKGAFTGASSERKGFFEIANNGTIFLDEVAEMSLSAQAKLLRLVQESELIRLGETKVRKIFVRIIVATNKDLLKEVREGRFREDLYYRLNSFPIFIPPLRERKEDIEELLFFFLKKQVKKLNMSVTPHIIPSELAKAKAYYWPGNVRELEHCVERALICCRDNLIRLDLPLEEKTEKIEQNDDSVVMSLKQAQCITIEKALLQCRGVISGEGGAAKLLGVHPNTLRHRMDKLNIFYKR